MSGYYTHSQRTAYLFNFESNVWTQIPCLPGAFSSRYSRRLTDMKKGLYKEIWVMLNRHKEVFFPSFMIRRGGGGGGGGVFVSAGCFCISILPEYCSSALTAQPRLIRLLSLLYVHK